MLFSKLSKLSSSNNDNTYCNIIKYSSFIYLIGERIIELYNITNDVWYKLDEIDDIYLMPIMGIYGEKIWMIDWCINGYIGYIKDKKYTKSEYKLNKKYKG